MFGRKKQHELSDDELAAQTLRNCQMSMGQIFQEQEQSVTFAEDDVFMQGFLESPEYRDAFAAYAKRMGKN